MYHSVLEKLISNGWHLDTHETLSIIVHVRTSSQNLILVMTYLMKPFSYIIKKKISKFWNSEFGGSRDRTFPEHSRSASKSRWKCARWTLFHIRSDIVFVSGIFFNWRQISLKFSEELFFRILILHPLSSFPYPLRFSLSRLCPLFLSHYFYLPVLLSLLSVS